MSRYAEAHRNRTGPGDARPTALQVVKDEGRLGTMKDKVFFVTGCSSGIGIETARALHATGGTIFVTGRDRQKTQAVIDDIYAKDPENKSPIHLIEMKLDSLKSVKAGVEEFLRKSDRLNVLITNAGVMATPYGHTEDGFETQFGTNHIGHFYLFQLLKPTLLKSTTPSFNSRVISVSSRGHRLGPVLLNSNFDWPNGEGYNPWVSYGQAKTANIWFANELDRRYGSKGLHATSLHPGGVYTGLMIHVPDDHKKAWETPAVEAYVKNAEQGAATSIYAAVSAEWEGKGGRYLSNCVEQKPFPEELGSDPGFSDDGHSKWAYDPEGEKKLWIESLRLLGLQDD